MPRDTLSPAQRIRAHQRIEHQREAALLHAYEFETAETQCDARIWGATPGPQTSSCSPAAASPSLSSSLPSFSNQRPRRSPEAPPSLRVVTNLPQLVSDEEHILR